MIISNDKQTAENNEYTPSNTLNLTGVGTPKKKDTF